MPEKQVLMDMFQEMKLEEAKQQNKRVNWAIIGFLSLFVLIFGFLWNIQTVMTELKTEIKFNIPAITNRIQSIEIEQKEQRSALIKALEGRLDDEAERLKKIKN